MEKILFNHDASGLCESFMLSEERSDKLQAAIVFESIVAHTIIVKDYGHDHDEAPRVLRTKTGVLSRTLQYAMDERERLFLSFIFINRHEVINNVMSALTALESSVTDSNLREKLLNAGEEAFGGKMTSEELLKHFEDTMRKKTRPLKPLQKLVRQVENSNYDFHLFNAMIDEDESSGYAMEVIEESLEVLKNLSRSGLFKRPEEEDED